jgi:uncharacterized protein (TIGR02271 family)
MKTVAVLYEDETAKRVAGELIAAGFDKKSIAFRTKSAGASLADLRACGIPVEAAGRYVAQLARGGTLLTIETDEATSPKATEIMSRHCARDFTTEAARRDVIPVIEEQLQIAKEDFESGGIRVHARMVAMPVEEEVLLREEHVDVERRRVDRPVTGLDYQAAELSMVERAEEAFATKTARVVEEVRVGKTVEEHKETIRGTLRHTEVDVANLPRRKSNGLGTATELPKGARATDRIPIVEERMKIGKREVESGGVVVRSRIVEEPVQQDVAVRAERAYVDRRQIDRPATDADYQPQDLEMVEHAEKVYATKSAHVVEEIRLGKKVKEHKETIRDTVRHTEIDVEDRRNLRDWDLASSDYRAHFDRTIASKGTMTWQQIEPAYRFGHELGNGAGEWSAIERDARVRWEARNPGTWDRVKDSVREAFMRARRGRTMVQHA